MIPAAYRALETRFARMSAIENAVGILEWDSQTMMPDGSAPGRAEQIATLRVLAHELLAAPEMADLLADAEVAAAGLEPWSRANLREMRRRWVHDASLPGDLVAANARAVSAAEMVWRSARPASDFAQLLPSLTEVLNLQRQVGAAKAESLGIGVYDALMDQWEPGARTAWIDPLFADLADFLPGFTDQVLTAQESQPVHELPAGPYPVETQRRLCADLMRAVGFDETRGRLDISLHPFCGGAAGDVRITTRYREDEFAPALMGVLHETGHAMYEQNRPAAWIAQPVGTARGMAMHESQSLIVEMQACRSEQFLNYVTPLLREAFGGSGPAWTAENLLRRYTRVKRDFIRVDADEVTYPAHVILRYRLEKAMIDGDLSLADLPSAWNDGLRAVLGITPPDDRHGCLQDIHWPSGGWGYFPSYTLGAMIAAQLFDHAQQTVPGLEDGLGRGDFRPLMAWLGENIHSKASVDTTDALITQATGRSLDVGIYKNHLRRRYLPS